MNWQQYFQKNKDLGYDEALRRYRIAERKKNEEEEQQWLFEAAARGGSAANAIGAAGGGGSAVGAALFSPNIVADASPNLYAIVLYWGTIVHANQYVVQRATNAAFTTGVTTIYTGDSPTQTGVPGIVDGNLTANTTYYYRVKAQDTHAVYLDSPYGLIATATTIAGSQHYGLGLGVDNL